MKITGQIRGMFSFFIVSKFHLINFTNKLKSVSKKAGQKKKLEFKSYFLILLFVIWYCSFTKTFLPHLSISQKNLSKIFTILAVMRKLFHMFLLWNIFQRKSIISVFILIDKSVVITDFVRDILENL